MGKWLVARDDGAFVADVIKSGGSYTRDITKARLFSTEDSARRDSCGNEHVAKLSSYFGEN